MRLRDKPLSDKLLITVIPLAGFAMVVGFVTIGGKDFGWSEVLVLLLCTVLLIYIWWPRRGKGGKAE